MAMQRFVGKDMKSALTLIKEKIGDDALILGDRMIPGGVEILVDLPGVKKSPIVGHSREKPDVRYKGLDSIPVSGSVKSSTASNAKKDSMHSTSRPQVESSNSAVSSDKPVSVRELENLRRDFKVFASAMTDQLRDLTISGSRPRTSVHEKVVRRLEQKGFCKDVIRFCLQDVGEASSARGVWKHCIVSLSRRLKTISMSGLSNVHIFLGPTGSGKTTTIAKLATKAVMEYGPDSVALLSTDRFRMGAVDQLRALSMALGTSIGIVDEKRPLKYWIKMFSQKRLLLVDTAGFHPGSNHWSNHIKRLEPYLNGSGDRPVHGHLVLPVTAQREFIDHSIKSYDRLSLRSAVLTKLDESMIIGPTLSCLLLEGVPVSWYCDGQAVPKDIHAAKSQILVSKALSQESVWSQDSATLFDQRDVARTNQVMESVE